MFSQTKFDVNSVKFSQADFGLGLAVPSGVTDVAIGVLGQSLTGDYFDYASALVALKADLESYVPEISVTFFDATDGGTYAAEESAGGIVDSFWIKSDLTAGTPLTNAYTVFDAITDPIVGYLCNLGQGDSARVQANQASVYENYGDTGTWTQTDLVSVTANGDAYELVENDIATSGYIRQKYTNFINAADETFTTTILFKKRTQAEQDTFNSFPSIRHAINSQSNYCVVDLVNGTIPRVNGTPTSTAISDNGAGFWEVTMTSTSTAADSTVYEYFYAANADDTLPTPSFSAVNVGNLTVKDPNPAPATYPDSSEAQVKTAMLEIHSKLKARYGAAPMFMETIGTREPDAGAGWTDDDKGTQVVRRIQQQLISENSDIYIAAEDLDLAVLDEVSFNVHRTEAAQLIAANRSARLIAKQLYSKSNNAYGADITAVSDASNVIKLITTPESSTAWDMGHSSNVVDLLPSAGKVSLFRVFTVDGSGNETEIVPTVADHNDEGHGTDANTLELTFASLSGDLVFYYGYDAGVKYTAPSTYEWADKTKAIKDINNIGLQSAEWRRVSGVWSKIY